VSEGHASQAAGTHWNPEQYSKFEGDRLRPALELLTRVRVEHPQLVYDLVSRPGGGGQGFNLSDGLSITLRP